MVCIWLSIIAVGGWEAQAVTVMNIVYREARFMVRNRSVIIWLFVLLGLSSLSVCFGMAEVNRQEMTIQTLIKADRREREIELSKHNDWGSAAYYNFHLTYDPPSDFAFAALGQRDAQPWKHRVRMLALEGQIYERDVGNPEAALIGRFDFAFLAAFIFPLVLIILLHDLRASERSAGRYNLLVVTATRASMLWRVRAVLRALTMFVALIVPLLVATIFVKTNKIVVAQAIFYLVMYTIFWLILCYRLSAWQRSGPVILVVTIGVWSALSVVIPASARIVIDQVTPIPSSSEILMFQRETVNDAWDLPKNSTLSPFYEQHPQWAGYEFSGSSFDWSWYYAFQQVGDQKTAALTQAYRFGRLERNSIAAWVAILSPPALLERSLQVLANTDLNAAIAYEDHVRAYHAELRAFYYPKLFGDVPFHQATLETLPTFESLQ
jgi:ABC-2 type transport system permease protein